MFKKFISILAGLMLLLTLVGCDENKKPYREAEKLMESEQYSEAADAFAALGDITTARKKCLNVNIKPLKTCCRIKKSKKRWKLSARLRIIRIQRTEIRRLKPNIILKTTDI